MSKESSADAHQTTANTANQANTPTSGSKKREINKIVLIKLEILSLRLKLAANPSPSLAATVISSSATGKQIDAKEAAKKLVQSGVWKNNNKNYFLFLIIYFSLKGNQIRNWE